MDQRIQLKSGSTGPGVFPATRWSLVLAVQEGGGDSERALGMLLEVYWRPLYAFARRDGLSAEDAEDGVQGFYQSLISRGSLRSADPGLGRLRSFLLGAFRNHLKDQWRGQHRARKGGGRLHISLEDAEAAYGRLPSGELTPERAYEKQWVLTLLDHVLQRLRAEFAARGKARMFSLLEGALAWNGSALSYQEIAGELRMSEAAVQQAVMRLRARYRRLLEKEISQTVEGPEQVESERAYLIQVISS